MKQKAFDPFHILSVSYLCARTHTPVSSEGFFNMHTSVFCINIDYDADTWGHDSKRINDSLNYT